MCGALGGAVDDILTAYNTVDDLYKSQEALAFVYVLNRPELMAEHPDWWM
jgi:hypothetical protein